MSRHVHKWSAGGPNFHLPCVAQRVQLKEQTEQARPRGRSVACIRSMLWRVYVARYMACIRSTLPMIIPKGSEYMLLWLSNCEWNQLDGREAGLDLIIGDFGEM